MSHKTRFAAFRAGPYHKVSILDIYNSEFLSQQTKYGFFEHENVSKLSPSLQFKNYFGKTFDTPLPNQW